MNRKRFFAFALTLALCGGLWVPQAARAVSSPAPAFTDVADPDQAQAAELLRLLGVVAGDGAGHFSPGDKLTRAEFCTMAIGVMGQTTQADAMKGYTFFNDVRGDHWARGYINYASRITVGDSGERLVVGVGNGCFEPDSQITFAQAVTMTTRLLGYSQKDVATGGEWYEGYLTAGRTAGLLEGLDLSPDAAVTRGQAAILFQNLLFSTPRGGGSALFTALGGTVTGDVVILSTSAVTADGTTGAVEVADGGESTAYKTDHVPFSSSLEGEKVNLMLDKDQKVVAIRSAEKGYRRVVTLAGHEINYITTSEEERLSIPTTATLYLGSSQTTYGAAYMDLRTGARVTLAYTATGKLEYVHVPLSASSAEAAVTRLTGIYEDASPSPRTPLTVRFLGERFSVLDQAVEELAAFAPGDLVTLYLTADGRVAGAVSGSKAKSTLVGVVTAGDASTATVTPVLGLKNADGDPVTFSGKVSSSAEKLVGELVTVSSSRSGYLTLTKLTESGAKGALNVQSHTLNGAALADRVYLYERTDGGAPQPISWSQITVDSVPAAQISYAGTDEAGRVNVLVLEDVTGDSYTYGFLNPRTETVEVPASGGLSASSYNVNYIDVTNSGGTVGFRVRSLTGVKYNTPGGMAQGSGVFGTTPVILTALTKVSRSAFDTASMTVTVAGTTYPISQQVQCYNKLTKTWFRDTGAAGVDAARAYAETVTIYYDKAPAQGGKVRLIVIE